MSVLSHRTEHLNFYRTDFREFLLFDILLTFVHTFRFWWKSDKVTHFTWRPPYICNILLFLAFVIETVYVLCDVQAEPEERID
jgi:hypothetical protein